MARPRATFDDQLRDGGGRQAGFDYLRLVLSVMVLVTHSINVCYGHDVTMAFWQGAMRPVLAVIVPMFFAVSGFLVTASLARSRSLISYAGLRILRIMPALIVVTLLCALVIGPAFTTLPLASYFTDPLFARFWLNMVGKIQYLLPGVFHHNPWADYVNNSLWTLPYEFRGYILLAVLALVGVLSRAWLFNVVLVGANVALLGHALAAGMTQGVVVPGPILVQCFLYGVAGYLYRQSLPYDGRWAMVCAVASFACLVIPGGDYIAPVFVAYVTLYLGVKRPRRAAFIRSGDYSYGIFLYGFPIQQAVVAWFGPTSAWINVAISLPVTVLLAVASWHGLEKPVLGLRPVLYRWESRWLQSKLVASVLRVRVMKQPVVASTQVVGPDNAVRP